MDDQDRRISMDFQQQHQNMILLNQAMALQVQGMNNVVNLVQMRRRRRNRARAMRTRPWLLRRAQFGYYENLMRELEAEDPSAYRGFVRCDPDMFREILERIRPRLTRQHNNYNTHQRPLDEGLMLAITMRYLATGQSYRSLMYGFRVAHNTICGVVKEVCQAILDEYEDDILSAPATAQQWEDIADQFATRWNFHNVLGALDGKHVAVVKPKNTGSLYYNYKKFTSIVLMALVDADYKFIWIDVGAHGCCSDAQLWNNCELKDAIENRLIDLPQPKPLPGDDKDMPYFILADDAFALSETLMKPFAHRQLSHDERIFNYRVSRARRVVENAFGILVNRFRCMATSMCHDVSTSILITTTCCLLHNLFRVRYPVNHVELLDREDQDHNLVQGAWRQGVNMHDMDEVLRGNTSNKEAKAQRQLLKIYYNSVGAVHWQERMILQ